MIEKGVLNGLDLFSGIGGLTKALDGYVKPVAYCEIEPYARAVLLSRMHTGNLPLAPIWDDVLTLHGTMLPQVDIIYGGFPCQDISCAGHGAGLGGKRSGLFFEIIRLMDEIRPTFVFLENVPNIRTKGLAEAIRHISERGFDCRWICLSAAEIGAPHKRERWFLLAYSNCYKRRLQPVSRGELKEEAIVGDNGPKKSMAYTNSQSEPGLPRRTTQKFHGFGTSMQPDTRNSWWNVEPNVGRVANGVPKRVDRLRALGNAVVPAQAREAFERLMGLKGGF